MKPRAKLRIVTAETVEIVRGSPGFTALTRNPALQSPTKFEPTEKKDGDVVI